MVNFVHYEINYFLITHSAWMANYTIIQSNFCSYYFRIYFTDI